MDMNRRRFGGALAGALSAGVLEPATAQTFPAKPVRLLVPSNPGTSLDAVARTVGEALTTRLGQSVVVENRPGAGGAIAAMAVARAPADGYTLLLQISSFMLTPVLYKSAQYDAFKDFTPVGLAARNTPLVLAIGPKLAGVSSLKELVDLSKAKPGELNYASPGVASPQHLAMESFKKISGANFTHVPFPTQQMITAVLGGEVAAMMASLTVAMPHVRSGRLRLLASSGGKRWMETPEVPTFAEAGYPDFKFQQWYGIVAPAMTPPAIVQRLHSEMAAVLALPQVRDALLRQGAVAASESTEEFSSTMRSDYAFWTDVLKQTGIKAE